MSIKTAERIFAVKSLNGDAVVKTFRQLLWFIIPLLVLPLFYYVPYAGTISTINFAGYANYLRLVWSDRFFWLTQIIFRTLIGVTACALLLLFRRFLFRRVPARLFSGIAYALLLAVSAAVGFGKAFADAVSYSSNKAAQVILNDVHASAFDWNFAYVWHILFTSLEVGVLYCLLFWLLQKVFRLTPNQ